MKERQERLRIGEALAEHARTHRPPPAYRTGIEAIDRVTNGGIHGGEVAVIAAEMGVGKSAALEQICGFTARAHPTLLLAAEMTDMDTMTRIAARREKVDYDEFVRLKFSSDEGDRLRVQEVYAYLDALKLDVVALEVGKMPTLRDIEEMIASYRPRIMGIDHLRGIDGWLGEGSARGRATTIFGQLVALATRSRTTIVAAHHLNRLGYHKRPRIEWLADTSAVEQWAHQVALLYRPFKDRGPLHDWIVEWVIAKNRNHGPCCITHTRWEGPTQTFWPLTDEELGRRRCCGKKPRTPSIDIPD